MAGPLTSGGAGERPRRRGGLGAALPAVASLLLLADAAWIGLAPAPPPIPLAVAATAALAVALGAAGHRLAGLLVPGEGWPARLAAAFLTAFTLAALPALVLGHLGGLWAAPYLAAVAVLPLLARALSRRPVGPSPFPPRPPLPAAAGWLRRLDRLERGLLLAALGALAVLWVIGVREHRVAPPGYFGVDDNSYQLSTVATWLDEGHLAMPRPSMGDPSTPYYPILANVVSWVLLAPFENLDFAARWSQLPFALASLAAVLALAGRLGLGRRSALVVLASLACLGRFFPGLALGAGNDHASAFALLVVLDALLGLATGLGTVRRAAGLGVYLGLGIGWMVGTKYLSLLYLPPVAGLALGAAAVAVGRSPAGGRGREAGRAALAAAIAGAGAALVGGYTYLRNWVSLGNPIFPSPVRWAGSEILPGWLHTTLEVRRQAPEFALQLPGFLLDRPDLWGWVGPWVLLPAALLAPVGALAVAVARRRPDGTGPGLPDRLFDAALLALPAVLFVVFVHLVPDHRDIRYILAPAAVAALGAGDLLDRLERRWPRGSGRALAVVLRSALWIAVVGHVVASHMPPWGGVVLVTGLAALAAWETRRPGVPVGWLDARRRPARAAALVLALALFAVGCYVAHRYEERKLENRAAPRFLAEHWTGGRVAYVGFNAPYLFWGDRLEHGLVLAPTLCVPPSSRLYAWGPVDPPEARWPFTERHARYRCWYRNLELLDVRWVVVVRPWDVEPERPWMVHDPDTFVLRYQDDDVEVWSVDL